MSENGKPAKTLANTFTLGQLTTYLGPLALVAWQGMVWATEIESNVKANQAQIEQLIVEVRKNEKQDQDNADRIIEALDRLARRDRVLDEPNSDSVQPVD